MAFYSNALNFPNLTSKGTPVSADILLLADSAASNQPKQCTVGSLPFASAALLPTTDVTGTSQSMASNNKYISDNAALVTLTLPTTATQGDLIFVCGGASGTAGWKIAQNASQLIHMSGSVTTTGTGGSLSSTNQFDAVMIECIVTNTTWAVIGSQGNLNGV